MPETYRITVTTNSGEMDEGLMNRSLPEVVNGLIGIFRKRSSWVDLSPDDLLKMKYALIMV